MFNLADGGPVRKYIKKLNRRHQAVLMSLIIGLLIAAGAGAVFVWQQPVVADVSYEPCVISYGDVLADWDGRGERQWNRKGYRYQVRSFSIVASSPGNLRPNVIEAEPKRISTGGNDACQKEFDERIDTLAAEYRYRGAITDDVRIGYPADSFVRAGVTYGAVRPGADVQVAGVNADSHNSAAAWVDDSARGDIYVGDGKLENIYCVNYRGCGDITEMAGSTAVRGQGFVFTNDNCPEGLECDDGWYKKLEINDKVKAGAAGLNPFSLRLSAVSTYAPVVGTEILMTFAYPLLPEPKLDLAGKNGAYGFGQAVKIEGNIVKPGPLVEAARLEFDLERQSLKGNPIYKLDSEELDRLNDQGVINFSYSGLATAKVDKRSCRKMGVEVIVVSRGEEFRSGQKFGYCVDPPVKTYSYSVAARGDVDSDVASFRSLAAETLGDSRGWARAGIEFVHVQNGGDFTLWLSSPEQMTSFSGFCSPEYSCRVGRDVIVNDNPWRNATPAWNKAGGKLRDYRHMVVNHEVGHFLGLGHFGCPLSGALAPVMQQQSIDLGGCQFNPWPTDKEISRL